MKIGSAVVLFIALMLTPELSEAAPNPAKSEYLKTTAGGISISGGEEPLFYSLTLAVRKKLRTALYVRCLFERPGKPDEPLVADSMIRPEDKSIFLESPGFQGIDNGGTYSVTVILYSDEERKEEVSRHRQDLEFKVPTKAFGKLGLKKP